MRVSFTYSDQWALCLGLMGFIFIDPWVAQAENYPSAPVRIVVPFPAGGGVDSAGRLIAQKLSESFNKSFVVDNRGGANGMIGSEAVAKSTKDGYTLLVNGANFVTSPILYHKAPYDPIHDFDAISLIALGPNVLVVHPSLPVYSVAQLITLAQKKPGEIGFAGSGSGSTPHLAGELFNTMAQVKMVHIPYRGSGPAIIGLLGGESMSMFLPAINARVLMSGHKVRPLAVTSLTRLVAMPELPTVAESGIKGYESSQWYGLLAPVNSPTEIMNLLNAQVSKILQQPDIHERLIKDGLIPMGGSREQFTHHLKSETIKWAKVIKQSGARVD
ncbi:MAG: tripartite tricarboxylate transporter substrate binding protein [Betaproteobacteria bacterium]